MTQEQVIAKAYQAYPEDWLIDGHNKYDVNKKYREGYIRAFTEKELHKNANDMEKTIEIKLKSLEFAFQYLKYYDECCGHSSSYKTEQGIINIAQNFERYLTE